MTRKELFDYIEEKLNVLAYRVKVRGKLNILDLHVHSENFYRDFLNLLYGWNLQNLNKGSQNVEAIDLVDEIHQIVVQVSSTHTKKKIEGALSKQSLSQYSGWRFKFITITGSAVNLRDKTFDNKFGLSFAPSNDIIDVESIIREIWNLPTENTRKIAEFIKIELGNEQLGTAIESDLVRVISMLSHTDTTEFEGFKLDNEFEVNEKIDFNSLINAAIIIKEYNVWQMAVHQVYANYDEVAVNKSYFVLQKIRSYYLAEKQHLTGDALFDAVRQDVKNEILQNTSSNELSREAIDICADVLVVDAFIRCKIFENPKGASNVTA